MHEILHLLAFLINLEEVGFKEVFTWPCHVDLYSSAENYPATMEWSYNLQQEISCNFKHGIGSASLRVWMGYNLEILVLHALDYERKLLIQRASS